MNRDNSSVSSAEQQGQQHWCPLFVVSTRRGDQSCGVAGMRCTVSGVYSRHMYVDIKAYVDISYHILFHTIPYFVVMMRL